MKVKELAKRFGVSSDTVRYYTQLDILHPVKDENNGYRHYSSQDAKRLDICIKAKRLGFTLSDIQHLLVLIDEGKSPYPELQQLLKTRLEIVKSELDERQAVFSRMQEAWSYWTDGDHPQISSSNSGAFEFWNQALSVPVR